MKIEIGKQYIRRDLKITEPVIKNGHAGQDLTKYPFRANAQGDAADSASYTSEGTLWHHSYPGEGKNERDLVWEYRGILLEDGKKYKTRELTEVTIKKRTTPSKWGDFYVFEACNGSDYGANGQINSGMFPHQYDIIAEVKEKETKMKIEIGKQYITKDGRYYTEVVTEKNKLKDGKKKHFYRIRLFTTEKGEESAAWNYELDGNWIGDKDSSNRLVAEYNPKKQDQGLFPLQVGQKYVTRDGGIVVIYEDYPYDPSRLMGRFIKSNDPTIRTGSDGWVWGIANGRFFDSEEHGNDIVGFYVEGKDQKKKQKEVPKKKNPVKYSGLTFIQAWELARETKGRYRFDKKEWLTFPEIKVTKEEFAEHKWEVEKK